MKKKKNQNKPSYVPTIIILFVTYVLFALIILATNRDRLTVTNIIVQLGALMVLIVSVGLYLIYADKQTALSVRKVLALCATMLLCYVLLWLTQLIGNTISPAPFALCALIVSLLLSNKIGFFANFVVILIYFLQGICFTQNAKINDEGFYLLFVGVITSVYASYALGKYYKRTSYLIVGVVLGVLGVICRAISYFMFLDEFIVTELLINLALAFGSGILTVTLMFLFLPIWERIFNVVSPFRFSEIANSGTELMRMMFEKAPGTYNHSLTVANYVEACASAIGENPYLARAVSYYHDIGKTKNPNYFSENQIEGGNPHDGITPEASVEIISSHTTIGLQLAREHHLPVEVQRAIIEHHGTMPLKYFYLKAKKYVDGDLPYDDYCYDGPKPTSKISAILMICDACEAALRAVNDRSKVEEVVDEIVAERMRFDQFSNCDITMKELDIVKSTIITTFLGIKHKRVKYPDAKLEKTNED